MAGKISVRGSRFLNLTALLIKISVCLVKMLYDKNAVTSPPQSVEVAAVQCSVATSAQEGMVPVDVLDAQFFDENILMIVYRPRKREHGALWDAKRVPCCRRDQTIDTAKPC